MLFRSKYLLKQRIGTPTQQKWITKLLGYSFLMEYKHGRENRAGDALSRRLEDSNSTSFFLISFPCSSWLDILKDSYNIDHEYQQLFEALTVEDSAPASSTLHNGLLFYKGYIFLSQSSPLKPLVLQHVHNSPCGGHSVYLKALHRVRQDFFWKGMVKDVKLHVQCCEVYQRVKGSTSKPTGLL